MIKENEKQIETLVKRAKEGEIQALEILIEIFTPYCKSQCRKIYLIDYDFEELLSISKFSILKAIHKYDTNRNSFTPYVMRTIKNNLYEVIKKSIRKREEEIPVRETKEGIPIIDLVESEVNIEELMVYVERLEKLKDALKSLTKQECEIVTWCYFNNKTIREYADKNHMDYWKVSKVKQRALKKMKKYLKEEGLVSIDIRRRR